MGLSLRGSFKVMLLSLVAIIIGKNTSNIFIAPIIPENPRPATLDREEPFPAANLYPLEHIRPPFSITEVVRDTRIFFLPRMTTPPEPLDHAALREKLYYLRPQIKPKNPKNPRSHLP